MQKHWSVVLAGAAAFGCCTTALGDSKPTPVTIEGQSQELVVSGTVAVAPSAWPIPVTPASIPLANVRNDWLSTAGNAPSNYTVNLPISVASTLTGLSVQVLSKDGATSVCSVEVKVVDANGGFVARLGRWMTSAGRDATVSFVPINVAIPAGYSLRAEQGNDFSDNCSSLISVYLTL